MAYGTFQVYERDLGYKGLVKELMTLDGANTKVGLPYGGKTEGRYSMAELADVAAKNEFGSGKVPERSFLRTGTDENRVGIFGASWLAVDKILGRRTTVRAAVSEVGDKVVKMVKHKIESGPFTPLKASTIAKKGHDVPLLETGQLFDSIQHKDFVRGSLKSVGE